MQQVAMAVVRHAGRGFLTKTPGDTISLSAVHVPITRAFEVAFFKLSAEGDKSLLDYWATKAHDSDLPCR